jgi:LacI family transcriptional regulator
MAVTIRDVARAAGVSAPVVSTVLHGAKGNTRVSAATRDRVAAVAAQLGYRPHFASRSLARRCSETLGLFVEPSPGSGLGFDYEGSILQGVEAVCRAHNYDLLAINLGGSQTPESCSHKFVEKRIDGLLLLHVGHNADWVEPLCSQHHNVAAVNYYGPCRNLDIVNFDNEAASRLAVENLVALGHRRLGYLGPMAEDTGPGATLRRDGFVRAVTALGLPHSAAWVLDAPNEEFMGPLSRKPYEGRFDAAAAVVASLGSSGPTAWLAYSDMIAVRVAQGLRPHGLRVSGDVSLVGIDNAQIGQYLDPPLATVQQPFAEMGAQATELLIQRAEQGLAGCPHVVQLFAPSFVARPSAAARRPSSITAA